MTQIVDLRPDFGNDFARIFLEKERMKLAQEAQKFREQQTKYENEQEEAKIGRGESLMQGETAGILQGLMGTPEGQQLLGQAAQPYADAFNTFFGGQSTPEQLGLNPQAMATGLQQSPEPYAAAGYARALQGAEKQQYVRGVEDKRFKFEEGKFDKTFGLDERRLDHQQFMDGARLNLEQARMEMEQSNFDRASTFQALSVVQGIQDRATAAFQSEVAYRINGLGEDARTAYQRSSMTHYGTLTPPSTQDFATQAGVAVDALGRGVPASMIGTIALGDGSDPLRQLANLGLDERIVAAIGKGLDNDVGGFEMYKEVHGAIAERHGRLTKDEKKAIEAQYGMDADDYYANQLASFNTWFAENYSDESPGRLISLYRNSLLDPADSGAKDLRSDEERLWGGTKSFASFMWSALTVWDASSSDEDRAKAIIALGGDPDTIAAQVTRADGSAVPDTPGAFMVDALTRWSTGGGQAPTGDESTEDVIRREGGWPAPDTPSEFMVDALTRWSTGGTQSASRDARRATRDSTRDANLSAVADQEAIPGQGENEQTMQDFSAFMWEAMTVWDARSGRNIGQPAAPGRGPTGAPVAPGPPREGMAPGTDPSQLQTSVFGQEGLSQPPSATPPQRGVMEMIFGGGMRPDSFSVPSDPRIDRPRVLRGDAAEVPGWLPPEQAQAYQDTAQMLRGAGVDEATVQLLLELNFPPPSTGPGRSAGGEYSNLF